MKIISYIKLKLIITCCFLFTEIITAQTTYYEGTIGYNIIHFKSEEINQWNNGVKIGGGFGINFSNNLQIGLNIGYNYFGTNGYSWLRSLIDFAASSTNDEPHYFDLMDAAVTLRFFSIGTSVNPYALVQTGFYLSNYNPYQVEQYYDRERNEYRWVPKYETTYLKGYFAFGAGLSFGDSYRKILLEFKVVNTYDMKERLYPICILYQSAL